LQVDRDGTLSCASFGESRPLGNVANTRIGSIVRTSEYLELVNEETRLKDSVCSKCAFVGACDTKPIARWFDSSAITDCPIEKYLCPMIEGYLEERGFFGSDFSAAAQQMMGSYANIAGHDRSPGQHSRHAN
jgi:uncharacterized protein